MPTTTMDRTEARAVIPSGTFTIASPSGEHRTLRIRRRRSGDLKGKRVLGLLTGPQNTSDYTEFAFVENDWVFVWGKFRGRTGGRHQLGRYDEHGEWSTFSRVAAGLLDLLSKDGVLRKKGFTLAESRVCGRCGRALTTPESIAIGLGPECATRGW